MTNHLSNFHPVISACASAIAAPIAAPTTAPTTIDVIILPVPAPEFDTTTVIAIAVAVELDTCHIAVGITTLYHIVPASILKVIIVKNHADLFVPISRFRMPSSTSLILPTELYDFLDYESNLGHFAATRGSITIITALFNADMPAPIIETVPHNELITCLVASPFFSRWLVFISSFFQAYFLVF